VLSQAYNRKFNGTFLTYAHTPSPYCTLHAPLPVQQPTDGMLLALVTEEVRLSVSFVMLLSPQPSESYLSSISTVDP